MNFFSWDDKFVMWLKFKVGMILKFRRSIRPVSEQFGVVPIMDPGVTSSDEKTESNKPVRIAVRFSSDCF